MASYEGEGPKPVDKSDAVNFHLWKFKMEMAMAEKDLWEIADGREEPPHSTSDPRVETCHTIGRTRRHLQFWLSISPAPSSPTFVRARHPRRHGATFMK